jgi:hypothetical protein
MKRDMLLNFHKIGTYFYTHRTKPEKIYVWNTRKLTRKLTLPQMKKFFLVLQPFQLTVRSTTRFAQVRELAQQETERRESRKFHLLFYYENNFPQPIRHQWHQREETDIERERERRERVMVCGWRRERRRRSVCGALGVLMGQTDDPPVKRVDPPEMTIDIFLCT